MVLDLKGLNQFVKTIPFKMETLQRVIPLVSRGHYIVTLDLQEAYFHVPIFPLHQQYLRFCIRGKH